LKLLRAIHPQKCGQQVAEQETLAVVGRLRRMVQVYRLREDDRKGVQTSGRWGRQQTGICGRWGRKTLGGLGGAAGQSNQEEAAPGGKLYDSATTNGVPPSLALISGTAETASALVE
jgi:hypothetical protein